MPKKTTFVLQLCITFMMAFSMSGTLGFINGGAEFIHDWPRMFIIAWPIAFIYTQFVTPIAFKIALTVAPPGPAAGKH